MNTIQKIALSGALVGAALVACVLYLPVVPIVFRYSRVVWIHFDRWAWPGPG